MNREKFREMYDLLMEQLDVSRELSDDEILGVIDELILTQARELFLSLKEKVELRQELFCSVRKLDVLQELIDDESVTEIMVNGPDHIFVERGGKLTRWNKVFTSEEKLEDVIQQIVGRCNRVVNESMPIVDARLENGARVNAVVYPVALNGPILTIRHNGKTDRFWKHHRRMCTVFKKTCSGKIFYCDRWGYRQWKNNIPWCCYRIYSKR